MSTPGRSASELAAAQVEQIVAAAHQAAERIRGEAETARDEARRQGERDAEEIVAEARRAASASLHQARKQAIVLTQDARRDAEGIIADAREEAALVRDRTRRAVDGRVAAAEKAAADVLAEARALSGGLRQLGRSLQDHAERILRDVHTAHKRMQADLRVGADALVDRPAEPSSAAEGGADPSPARAAAAAEREPAPSELSAEHDRRRRNPFDELEVPGWVAPDP